MAVPVKTELTSEARAQMLTCAYRASRTVDFVRSIAELIIAGATDEVKRRVAGMEKLLADVESSCGLDLSEAKYAAKEMVEQVRGGYTGPAVYRAIKIKDIILSSLKEASGVWE